MMIFDPKDTAITDASAQPCAPLPPPLRATPGDAGVATQATHAAEPQQAAQARLMQASEHCRLALDHIQMAEMVVRFLEHLLDAKARKSMAADELRSSRSTLGQARADLANAQQAYHEVCKAFHAAHQDVLRAQGKVCGPSGAAHVEDAQPA